MDENKASIYLVAIVGVVAAVGILLLLTGITSGGDLSGQAIGIGGTSQVKDAGLASGLKDDIGVNDVSTTTSAKTCVYPSCCSEKPACAKTKQCGTSPC